MEELVNTNLFSSQDLDAAVQLLEGLGDDFDDFLILIDVREEDRENFNFRKLECQKILANKLQHELEKIDTALVLLEAIEISEQLKCLISGEKRNESINNEGIQDSVHINDVVSELLAGLDSDWRFFLRLIDVPQKTIETISPREVSDSQGKLYKLLSKKLRSSKENGWEEIRDALQILKQNTILSEKLKNMMDNVSEETFQDFEGLYETGYNQDHSDNPVSEWLISLGSNLKPFLRLIDLSEKTIQSFSPKDINNADGKLHKLLDEKLKSCDWKDIENALVISGNADLISSTNRTILCSTKDGNKDQISNLVEDLGEEWESFLYLVDAPEQTIKSIKSQSKLDANKLLYDFLAEKLQPNNNTERQKISDALILLDIEGEEPEKVKNSKKCDFMPMYLEIIQEENDNTKTTEDNGEEAIEEKPDEINNIEMANNLSKNDEDTFLEVYIKGKDPDKVDNPELQYDVPINEEPLGKEPFDEINSEYRWDVSKDLQKKRAKSNREANSEMKYDTSINEEPLGKEPDKVDNPELNYDEQNTKEPLSEVNREVEDQSEIRDDTLKNDESEVTDQILLRIADWKSFARGLKLNESDINTIESDTPESCLGDTFDKKAKRRKYLVDRVVNKFTERNSRVHDFSDWNFWKPYLQTFQNGKEVIEETERFFNRLDVDVTPEVAHKFISNNFTYLGHAFDFETIFEVDKILTVSVNVDSSTLENISYQDIPEWSQAQQRYMDIYNLFKEKQILNFFDLHEHCPILKTLEQYLTDTEDSGFATKGYQFKSYLKQLYKGINVNEDFCKNYFCFIANENVALYFMNCQSNIVNTFVDSTQNIHVMNVLHETFQTKGVIQVNVLVYKDNTNTEFCDECTNRKLIISEDILMDIAHFKLWFIEIQKMLHKLKNEANLRYSKSSDENSESLIKEIIAYEALINTDSYSSPTQHEVVQADETKNCYIFPTLVQFTFVRTNKKHILLRGPYGSGKSFLVREKLGKSLSLINVKDIVYYIHGGKRSQYIHHMESIKLKFLDRNINVCNINSLVGNKDKPRLSNILNQLNNFWKDQTVHVFIDDFDSSNIDLEEISELQKILSKFLNSFIVVAVKSWQKYVHENEEKVEHMYDLLTENTSFSTYTLENSFRYSVEINEFIRATFCIINSNIMENYQADLVVSAGPVSLFILDKKKHKSIKSWNQDDVSFTTSNIYLSTLQYIVHKHGFAEKRLVVCTQDEILYKNVHDFLENESLPGIVWTSDVSKFDEQYSKYNVLLTTCSSIRGFEFSNLILLMRFGKTDLTKGMIDAFSCTTTKLFVITDNVGRSLKPFEKNLLKTWRTLDCVAAFDCIYDNSKDEIAILQGGETKYTKSNVSSMLSESK